MKIVVSGIQPTGNLHIGNYLGSLKGWKNLQDNSLCVFPIVDLHALSGDNLESDKLSDNILKTFATYIAAGVNPEKAIVFRQSDVSYHTELMWILSNVTSMGKLNRMTQFKDKGKNKASICCGLFTYPILMAADILLYRAHSVPVGDDQLQHLELTNDIAASFNAKYNIQHFNQVLPIISGKTKRIMSLRNASNKMSKSDISDMTRINLTDSNDEINIKIRKAKTDLVPEITANLDDRHEITNLINIYAGCSDLSFEKTLENNIGKTSAEFKNSLSDVVISAIEPIRVKVSELLNDKAYIESCLTAGCNKAIELSDKNMCDIKRIIGVSK
ncbi:MAG: tryptophan--tRNA ligase [Rickettsiales bacterium]|nr:tryptophan--tRNA ligase [Rickettsiales bacterium]